MKLVWKWAGEEDLPILVQTRLKVLRAANHLPEDAPLPQVEAASRAYYTKALADGSHAALLVYAGEEIIAAGGVSFYQVMPTCDQPTGRKAYIMNMYTAPAWRRQGIAMETLRMLLACCHRRGVEHITLEATEEGRPLYEIAGFVPMQHEMKYKGEYL